MNCPRCNSVIPDGSLICPVCGEQCAVSNQRARVEDLKAQSKLIAHNSLHSKRFLAMTILMTVASVCELFSCFTASAMNGAVSFNFDFTVIFTILAAVFSWIAYTSTDANLAGQHLRRISIYDAAQWIIILIATCIIGIVLILAVALKGILSSFISENWSEFESYIYQYAGDIEGFDEFSEMLAAGANIIFAVLAVVLVIVLAIMICLCIIHFKRRRFMKKVGESIDTGCYNVAKNPPYVSSIVYAILCLIGSASSIGTALFSGGTALIGVIDGIAIAAYILISAMWMSQLHKDELANNDLIRDETDILNNLIYASQNAVPPRPAEVYRPESNDNTDQ